MELRDAILYVMLDQRDETGDPTLTCAQAVDDIRAALSPCDLDNGCGVDPVLHEAMRLVVSVRAATATAAAAALDACSPEELEHLVEHLGEPEDYDD